MWDRIKAACLNSLTIAFSYVLVLAGAVAELLPSVLDALLDVQVKASIPPSWLGTYTIAIGALTFACRMRSLKAG